MMAILNLVNIYMCPAALHALAMERLSINYILVSFINLYSGSNNFIFVIVMFYRYSLRFVIRIV